MLMFKGLSNTELAVICGLLICLRDEESPFYLPCWIGSSRVWALSDDVFWGIESPF